MIDTFRLLRIVSYDEDDTSAVTFSQFASEVVVEQTILQARVWLRFAMFLCVLAIVVGLLIPSDLPMLKIYTPSVFFALAALLPIPIALIWPRGEVDRVAGYKLYVTVGLIWMVFPFPALLNAWTVAMGVYDPLLDDGYVNSMSHWWAGVILQLLIGIMMTSVYLQKVSMIERKRWSLQCCFISWVSQLAAMVVWVFGPAW